MYTRIDLNGIRKKPINKDNGSIRARKHVHIPVNSACAETRLACEQVLHLGESREFPREPHAKGDARARGGEEFLLFSF